MTFAKKAAKITPQGLRNLPN